MRNSTRGVITNDEYETMVVLISLQYHTASANQIRGPERTGVCVCVLCVYIYNLFIIYIIDLFLNSHKCNIYILVKVFFI